MIFHTDHSTVSTTALCQTNGWMCLSCGITCLSPDLYAALEGLKSDRQRNLEVLKCLIDLLQICFQAKQGLLLYSKSAEHRKRRSINTAKVCWRLESKLKDAGENNSQRVAKDVEDPEQWCSVKKLEELKFKGLFFCTKKCKKRSQSAWWMEGVIYTIWDKKRKIAITTLIYLIFCPLAHKLVNKYTEIKLGQKKSLNGYLIQFHGEVDSFCYRFSALNSEWVNIMHQPG